jgi:hypothetical protein
MVQFEEGTAEFKRLIALVIPKKKQSHCGCDAEK